MEIHSPKVYRSVMKEKHLFESKNKTITAIAKKYNVPRCTVSGWYHGKQPIYRFCVCTLSRKTFEKDIPLSAKNLTPEKSYLLGAICGDGYVNYKNFYVSLEVTSMEFIQKFQKCFIKTYGPIFCGSVSPTCNGKRRIIICGREMTKDIQRYLPVKGTFYWHVPRSIRTANEECRIGFLQGFFDSEGSVNSNYSLEMFSSNIRGLSEVKELVNSLGIKTSKIKSYVKNNKPQYVIYITGRKNIVRFINIIGTNISHRFNSMKNILLRYHSTPDSSNSLSISRLEK